MISYISLGSNLEQPEQQLQTALEVINNDKQLALLKVFVFCAGLFDRRLWRR